MAPIPKPRTITRSTGLIVGLAGTASASPLLFFVPGFEERLAAGAAKWGPRWNRGFATVNRVVDPVWKKGVGRVEPKVQRGLEKVEKPLKSSAVAVDKQVKPIMQRVFPSPK